MSNCNEQPKRRAHRDQLPSEMLEEIEGDIARVMRVLLNLRGHVATDDLTGLLRRNEFFHHMEEMVGQHQEVALLLLDIDNFKRINDIEGHVVGDHVIQRVSRVIQRCTKAGAHVGRFGGEEFVVAISVSREDGRRLAEALRRQIQREVNVTVSVGVATACSANWNIRKMVGMADKALFEAKHAGKNQVCLAA